MEIGITAAYLMVLSFFDIKEKQVPVLLLAAGLVIGLGISVYNCLRGREQWLAVLIGILPGVFLLLVAAMTKKAGWGDGIVLTALGLICGYRESIFLLTISLLSMSVLSVILLVFRKVGRNTALPYLPFLGLAYIICCMMR